MPFIKRLDQKYITAIFWGLLALQLVSMLIISQNIGSSKDDNLYRNQAGKVFDYYKSLGEDKAALESSKTNPTQIKGQSFDNLMFAFEKVFEVEKTMEMRHFFIAIFGWLIILITGLLAKKYWGYKAAILSIILLYISPRFLGHSFNNSIDIPFAFGFILGIYGVLNFVHELPKIKASTLLMVIGGIAFSISIQLAGIIPIGFLVFFSVWRYLFQKPSFSSINKERVQFLKKIVLFLPLISVLSYGLGILFWPYLFENPIKGLGEILNTAETSPNSINQLFKGEIISSANLPANYIITYILYTYPLFVLFGSFFALALIPSKWHNKNRTILSYLILVALGGIVWMSYKNADIYGGIGSILFIYPIVILISLNGFLSLQNLAAKSNSKILKYVPPVLIFLLALAPASHIVQNYPYSYVYFNEIAGGLKSNSDKFETDYAQHSLKNASKWLIENELSVSDRNDSQPIKVVSNDILNTSYYLKPEQNNISIEYTQYYEKHKKEWDYAIFYCTQITPSQITNNLWPPKGTIHTEEVNGFPIAAVVKRISHEDYKGFEALKTNKTTEAKKHFKSFLVLYPENEEVLEGYARALLTEKKPDSTLVYANNSLLYNPRQIGALFLKASAHNVKKEYDKAIVACNDILSIKESFAEAHYQKGLALKSSNNPNEALKEFRVALGYKRDYYGAYIQSGEIFMNYKRFKDAIEKVYMKTLALRPNDLLSNANIAKCYHFLDDNNKAETYLRKASEQGSRNINVIKMGCRIEMRKGELNSVAQLLNMVSKINNDSELFVIRAMYMIKQDKAALGKQYLDKALEIDNTNKEAQALLTLFKVRTKPFDQQKKETKQSVMFQNAKKKQVNPN